MTHENGSIVKAIAVSAIGAVASYYAVAWAKRMLEEKPLKARVREGKAKVVDMKDAAVEKASNLKSTAKAKANELIQDTKHEVDDLVEEKRDFE